jgi:hypothetical protein
VAHKEVVYRFGFGQLERVISPELMKQQAEDPNSPISGNKSGMFFDEKLEFGEQFVEWKSFEHPQYGKVEMGGEWRKFRGRIPPRFMNEELCHRNMSFTLYQADEMPKMEFGETTVKKVGDNVYRVWIDLTNNKVAPTITAKAASNNVVRPDLITFEGKPEIITASWISGKESFDYLNPITEMIDQKQLDRLMIRNGHPGKTTRTLQYLVKGTGKVNITYDSVKGGKVSATIDVK